MGSARFAQPLTDTRRPALAQTSALATPGAGIVTIAPGTTASARTVAAVIVRVAKQIARHRGPNCARRLRQVGGRAPRRRGRRGWRWRFGRVSKRQRGAPQTASHRPSPKCRSLPPVRYAWHALTASRLLLLIQCPNGYRYHSAKRNKIRHWGE